MIAITQELNNLLATSAARHSHLCPRQVLGVRAGLAGAAWLGLSLPRPDRRLLVLVETDGCFVDGVEVAAGVTVGRRTLRVEDYGKVAATFVDTETGAAVRLAPHPEARVAAGRYAAGESDPYQVQLSGYAAMPEVELFVFQEVLLTTPLAAILSQPGLRVRCVACGEEIINEREVIRAGQTFCRACAGPAYYTLAQPNPRA